MAGVADHVSIGQIEPRVTRSTGFELLDQAIRDFGRFHPRSLFERQRVARDFDISLKTLIEETTSIAVPKVSDVTVFLGLANGELGDAISSEIFAECPVDIRGFDEVMLGDLEVSVVLHHAGKEDVRPVSSIEERKCFIFKGSTDLHGAIASKIKEDHRRAILDGPDGLAAFRANGEGRQVLIADPRVFVAERLDRHSGAGEDLGLSGDMSLPPSLDHSPFGFVSIHGDDHAPAAGRNLIIPIR